MTSGSSMLPYLALPQGSPISPQELETIFNTFFVVSLAFSLVNIALNLLQAIGLWLMKNWARIIVLILNGLGFVGMVIIVVVMAGAGMLSGTEGFRGFLVSIACVFLFVIGLQGYTIFWFWANRDLFD